MPNLYLLGGTALVALLLGFGGGFYLEDRLDQAAIIRLSTSVATEKGELATLQHGLDTCNTSVAGIAVAGKKLTDAAQQLVDQANANRAKATAAIAAIGAIKSSDEKCPVAQSIIERAFQ